jgi:hypothetical protein
MFPQPHDHRRRVLLPPWDALDLEPRALPAAWLPGSLANVPLVRWTPVGGTADDTARLAATFADVAAGTSLQFVLSGPRKADLTVLIGGPQAGYATYGTVRHPTNRRGVPYGHGQAVISLPAGWTVDGAAHELGHALGLVHVSAGPSAPEYAAAEWARLDEFGATVGWSETVVQAQYGKQAGARDNGYDATSLWNIDPYTQPAFNGPAPHLSAGDRQALAGLFGPGGALAVTATHRGGRRGR